MEYQIPTQPIPPQAGNGKKAVIIASVAAVALAGIVLVVVLVRNAALRTDGPPVEPGPGGEVTGGGDGGPTRPPPGGEQTTQPSEVAANVIENPSGTLPPDDDANGTGLSAPPPAGISRQMTAEEKAAYGFDPAANIWMTTSRPTDGSRPEVTFEDRSPAPSFPPDADNDGLSDADEPKYGTDPKKADTDGDGATDGDEVLTYKTDPLKADTDGDGVGDHDEAEAGTDPLKP